MSTPSLGSGRRERSQRQRKPRRQPWPHRPSRRTARGRISTPSTPACSSCWRCTCRPTPARSWSRISPASACLPADGSTSWRASPTANRPVLHPRDRFGRDEDWIEYHPAYREMEAIAFGDFQFHAMSHRAGVLGLDAPLPPVAKYACQYLFVQGEFGIMCPISVTDTSIHLLRKYASPELQGLPAAARCCRPTRHAVEGHAVHDREGRRLRHRPRSRRWRATRAATWRLYGEKWFCSHADADVALMLARPEGAPAGTRGPRACSPCRGGSRTARATATGSCG